MQMAIKKKMSFLVL